MFVRLDQMLEKWYDLFLSVVNNHLPIRKRRVKLRTQPEWFGNDIIDAIKIINNFAKCHDVVKWRIWKNRVNYLILESKSVYFRTLLDKNKSNPKTFWKIFLDYYPKIQPKMTSNSHIKALR